MPTLILPVNAPLPEAIYLITIDVDQIEEVIFNTVKVLKENFWAVEGSDLEEMEENCLRTLRLLDTNIEALVPYYPEYMNSLLRLQNKIGKVALTVLNCTNSGFKNSDPTYIVER